MIPIENDHQLPMQVNVHDGKNKNFSTCQGVLSPICTNLYM